MESCLFCKIAAKEINADVVYEDDVMMAFRDIHPRYPVHILLIPKKHVVSAGALTDADEGVAGKLMRMGGQLAAEQGIAESGFRLVTNAGPDAGQEVHHLHIHLLGGKGLNPL